MLLLSFYIGIERYTLPAKDVVEILPLTKIKRIPHAPEFILGILDYRGAPVPIIDLCQLIEQRNCNKVLSSRIILLHYIDAFHQPHILGVTAEKVTETININKDNFHSSGISLNEAPYLGAVTNENDNVIQFIETNKLLPQEVQSMLFQSENSDSQTGS